MISCCRISLLDGFPRLYITTNFLQQLLYSVTLKINEALYDNYEFNTCYKYL